VGQDEPNTKRNPRKTHRRKMLQRPPHPRRKPTKKLSKTQTRHHQRRNKTTNKTRIHRKKTHKKRHGILPQHVQNGRNPQNTGTSLTQLFFNKQQTT